jgi:hypothetical protein
LDSKKVNKGCNSQSKYSNTSKDLEKKSSHSKNRKDWFLNKQETVSTNEETALKSIPESVRIDKYKV